MGDLTPVVLRARTAEDFDALYELAADLDTWEERNPGPPAPLTRETYAARQARIAEDQADAAAFVVDVEGSPVGTASLFGFNTYVGHAEIGIALVPQARGRGIGTEAIRQLVTFGFERRNLRRIHLQAIASNAPALRAYEKAGFGVEGRLREHAWVRGAYEDIVLMGILRSERPTG
ncbi:MAG TPA: GNAT family protein [Mycobacteriales bacterium]|nr:GNAT family protein [Mycobacteriales bacterium]